MIDKPIADDEVLLIVVNILFIFTVLPIPVTIPNSPLVLAVNTLVYHDGMLVQTPQACSVISESFLHAYKSHTSTISDLAIFGCLQSYTQTFVDSLIKTPPGNAN